MISRSLPIVIVLPLAACSYDASLGRSEPPLSAIPPGHPALRWAETIGGVEQDNLSLVATDAYGDIFVAGTTACGPMDFAPPPPSASQALTSCPAGNNFVAKLDHGNGSLVWGTTFAQANLFWNALAPDAAGASYLLLTVYDPTSNDPCGRDTGVSLLKFDPAGQPLWRYDFPTASGSTGSGLALSNDGTVAITGTFRGSIDLGRGPIATVDACQPGVARGDGFIAFFTPSGTLLGGQAFLGPGGQELRSAMFTPDGDVEAVAISYPDAAGFGGPPVAGSQIVRFGVDGTFRWSVPRANIGGIWATLDSASHYVVETVDIASQARSLEIYDGEGALIESNPLADPVRPVAIEPDGMLVVFSSPALAQAGQGVQTFSGNSLKGDAFLVAYDEEADYVGGTAFSSTLGTSSCLLLDPTFSLVGAAAANGAIAAIGNSAAAVDLGGGLLWSHGDGQQQNGGGCVYGDNDGVVAVFDWASP